MSFFSANKKFWIVAGILLGLALLLLVFQVGFNVGARKAFFACRWEENYERNFGGPHVMMLVNGPNAIDPHGSFGRVLRVDPTSLVIKDPRGAEKIIEVTTDTEILRGTARLQLSAIKPDDQAVVIGHPMDNGRIEAELIRLLPTQP